MSDDLLPSPYARDCWCGDYRQFAWSHEFNVCRVCGTLVSRAVLAPGALEVKADEGELYSKDYWLKRQGDKYGLPTIVDRARLDLPERCVQWLKTLLARKPPGPGVRTLELGCAHGGFVALMQAAGYQASGLEMSPWVVNFARETFGIDVCAGPLERQTGWAPGSFDAIILNDVIEHLPDPLGTLACAVRLLKPDGLFLIQTPEYKEHLRYADLVALGENHTRPMHGKNEEHLFLYSHRSTQMLWARLGLPHVAFIPALFPYDMAYLAGRAPLPAPASSAEISAALERSPGGRIVQALLDKDNEAAGLRAEVERLQKSLASR
jgi:2-polyprenyl-3-methyl-5-hydroxy-6-metoxy-1,4-benzoquinol methylase